MIAIPPLTSDILALCLDGLGSPSIKLNLPESNNESGSHGWGFGWYPGDHQSAMVAKDPAARGAQVLAATLTDWSNFRSTTFLCKVRGADKGYTHTETQPFSRSFAGRDWLFLHNGDLDKPGLELLQGKRTRFLDPLGKTDSELAFCNLLALIQEGEARQLSEVEPDLLWSWFQRFDALGSADMMLTDGQSLACYQGMHSPKQLRYGRIQPPHNQGRYDSEAAHVALSDARDTYRTALVVSSSPFASGAWTDMTPGQLIIARRGALVWNSAFAPSRQPAPPPAEPVQAPLPLPRVTNVRAITTAPDGRTLSYRTFEITHATRYSYAMPVEHSTHLLRLQPVDDPVQQVERASLVISTAAEEIQYEDVFGNQVFYGVINAPYSTLTVEASSIVRVYAAPPDDHSLSRRQTTIPLVWMPWQREMMMPYLLPMELPESQLLELTEYAMSFVERNDYHLLRTIEDLNFSIYRDYTYMPGATALNTTPFEVYASRRGVCQDFANLFICLARLLSIPARYRMGYIYTGANYANKIQSDASHAWAEVYLPYVGWRGFDPTNGCMVAQDHIRVACGRNYRDATPTSGTIYKGGGGEQLAIDVKVRELHAT